MDRLTEKITTMKRSVFVGLAVLCTAALAGCNVQDGCTKDSSGQCQASGHGGGGGGAGGAYASKATSGEASSASAAGGESGVARGGFGASAGAHGGGGE